MPAPDRIVSIGAPVNIDGARFRPCLLADGRTWWNPSVTAILDETSHKHALTQWAASEERKGLLSHLRARLEADQSVGQGEMLAALLEAQDLPYFHRSKKKKAADIGSVTHAWIDWYLHKSIGVFKGTEPILLPESQIAVNAAREWMDEVEFEPVAIELSVASQKHDVCGQLDVKGKATIDSRGRKSCDAERKMIVPDWKASAGVYREMRVQNIAYRGIDAETSTNGDKSRGGVILRVRKSADDPVPFEVVPVPYDPIIWEGFLAARKLWGTFRHLESKFEGGFRN